MKACVVFALKKLRVFSAALFALAAVQDLPASAQEPQEVRVKESLVHLIISGVPNVNTQTGVEPDREEFSKGTGFLVSQDGFILTNYHLMKNAGAYKADKIEIKASFGPTINSAVEDVQLVKSDKAYDLLLLKVGSRDSQKFKPVVFATSSEIMALQTGAKISLLGFPGPENPILQKNAIAADGTISDFNGSDAHLWQINLTTNAGQSGSPIFQAVGGVEKVVGIATSDSKINKDTEFMIPAFFADSLLAHVKFAGLEQKYAALEERINTLEKEKVDPSIGRIGDAENDLKDIQKYFTWTGIMVGSDLTVKLQKIVSDGPMPQKIKVNVTPVAYNADGSDVELGTYPKSLVLEPGGTDKFRGSFSFKSLKGKIQRDLCDKNADRMPELALEIRAIMATEGGNEAELEPYQIIVKTNLKKEECDPES
jgi:S1-C subfamily serine protease